MLIIQKLKKDKNYVIFILLILGILIPLIGLFSMSLCDNSRSINDCLMDGRYVFSDFFYQYNTIRYIYHHGSFPDVYIATDGLGNFDGTPTSENQRRMIYHSPLYYYFGAFLYSIAKKANIDDLFLIYFAPIVLLFFINLFFFFSIRHISKKIYKKIDTSFIIYSMALFLFLPVHLHLSLGLQNDITSYLFYILAIFCYFKIIEYKTLKYAIVLGFIFGISMLSRISSVFFIGGFVFQMVYLHFKKERVLRNNLFISLLVASVIGIYPFIRNIMLFQHPLGDIRSETVLHVHNILFTFFKVFRAYWGGMFGGNDSIKPILGIFILILTLMILLGLLIYFRKYKNYDADVLWMGSLSVIVLGFLFMCNPLFLLSHGVCKGDILQDRFLSPLNPIVAVFASIFLVKIKGALKSRVLKVLPDIFVGVLALLFIIDFLTAVIRLN